MSSYVPEALKSTALLKEAVHPVLALCHCHFLGGSLRWKILVL